MSSLKLLITGATGYIGGSVLTTLLKSDKAAVKSLQISALYRSDDQAKKLSELGVTPIKFRDLDDIEVIQKAASEHDVVIHTASGFHTPSALALVAGLADRKAQTGNDVYYIHTSGTSNLADQPITKAYLENREFSDTEDIYSYEKSREEKHPYAQRTTELAAIDAGLEKGIKTYIIMSPTIYGTGNGSFNVNSIQIPVLMKNAITMGYVERIGDGTAIWDYVHIADLAPLYEIILDKAISGEDIPYGKKGIYFSGTGRFSWGELATRIANAGHEIGALKSTEVKEAGLREIADRVFGGLIQRAELGFASNSRTKSDLSRSLGWRPQKTSKDWEDSFTVEFKIVVGKQ